MKPVYVEKDKNLEYFICSFPENNEKETVCIDGSFNDVISKNAFSNSNIRFVHIKNKLYCIFQSTFENCECLEVVLFEESDDSSENKESTPPEIKGIKLKSVSGDFTVQTNAFKNCCSLNTVIFPNCDTLTIEKNAFSDCEALRTVVAFADNIDFTENPFADCPEYLTFVCKKGSAVEKFARENGYRIENV